MRWDGGSDRIGLGFGHACALEIPLPRCEVIRDGSKRIFIKHIGSEQVGGRGE